LSGFTALRYLKRSLSVVKTAVLSEYGITSVKRTVALNRIFRAKGWITVKDELGLELLDQLADSESGAEGAHMLGGQGAAGDFAALAAQRQGAQAQQLLGDLSRLLGGAGAQVYCLECAGLTPLAAPVATPPPSIWLALLGRIAG
jgi:hypothetical protein